MDDTARVILHEVMEQQTVSIAKAGIVCSLSARAGKGSLYISHDVLIAVLASANPINSRYDPKRSVVDNISLPASLMSRFGQSSRQILVPHISLISLSPPDLIYLMIDYPNEKVDRALAEHLARLYAGMSSLNNTGPPIDRRTFTSYISFAKE